MEDQGEKIIFLARELLNADVHELPVKKKTVSITMTFRTLCFTTLLAAAGGGIISTVAQEHIRPLNRYEKVELQALVFYAARLKGIQEDIVRQEVGKQVGVSHFDDITAKEFPTARRYLQEQAQ
jgi:hypothetical protein